MLGIIHSIFTRENNPHVLNLAMSVLQSRENSKNAIKPSILTKKSLGALSSGTQHVDHYLWLSFTQQILYYWDSDSGTVFNIFYLFLEEHENWQFYLWIFPRLAAFVAPSDFQLWDENVLQFSVSMLLLEMQLDHAVGFSTACTTEVV